MSNLHSNHLLSAVSAETRYLLEQRSEAVPMPVRTTLFEPGVVPKYAYFMTSGVASLVANMQTGGAVEVGLYGCEAMPGSLHLLGDQHSATHCFMQVDGTARRISFRYLQQIFMERSDLHTRVLQTVQYEALILTQLSACNRLHEVEERLARWLLMVADRLESDTLPLTQEFIGLMLGIRRSSVTMSAGTLQQAGLIEYHRGHVKIRDRAGLEAAACECYHVVYSLRRNLFAASL